MSQGSLDLTHVVYDDSSVFSLILALITLSPILLMASYAALAVQTREYIILVMWGGQLAGEALNWLLKHIVKQDRPIESIGNGYGFPSSHSQYMAYFASFLICHLFFRHRFGKTNYPLFDILWRVVVYLGLLCWSSTVAYSRYYLGYHNVNQILWGIGIGAALGVSVYIMAELIPQRQPTSLLGNIKRGLLSNPLCTWLQIRDGWAIWSDGGREDEWRRWKIEWEKQWAAQKRSE